MIRNKLLKDTWCVLLILLFSSSHSQLFAQSNFPEKTFSLDDLVDMALENHPSLKIVRRSIEIAQQDIEVAKLERLPTLEASTSASYLTNAFLFSPGFSSKGKLNNIHFGNTLSMDAYQTIYSGSRIKKNIESKELAVGLTELALKSDQQDVKLLVSGQYIELYNLENKKNIYVKNIELAKNRLKQISSFFKQGMVTNDDLIRAELQLSDLFLIQERLETEISIVQNQLLLATGLKQVKIKTDLFFLAERNDSAKTEFQFIEEATMQSPRLKNAEQHIVIQEKTLEIVASQKKPTLYAFSGTTGIRPIRTAVPQLDLYANSWTVGIGLKYDISNLYTLEKKVKYQQLNIEKAKDVFDYEVQQIELKIQEYYRYENLAWSQWQTFKKNEQLANENYRITEKKYFNKLAIYIDLANASNLKLEAELKSATARSEAIYAHHRLLNTVGSL